MECCRHTHTECPAWERINLITHSFLAALISAIRLDKGLTQRLACSELIMQSRAPNYCKVIEIEQISTAKIVKVPGSRISATRKFLPRSACGDHSPERP